jgi:hypothetical protein
MGTELGVDCMPSCQPMPFFNPLFVLNPVPSDVTHPSSVGVAASAVRPNICQYHAVEPIAKTVAPIGRALFLKEDAAPSVELDVEAARCINQFVSHCVNRICRAPKPLHDADDASSRFAGVVGLGWWVCGSRTEAVLLEALSVVAPAVRAVRSADRANMLYVSWPGARRRWINGVAGGGDR